MALFLIIDLKTETKIKIMKKSLVFILSLLLSSSYISAQAGGSPQSINGSRAVNTTLNLVNDVSEPLKAVGSPYINEVFLPVKVKGYDDKLFTGRFNAYNGEMEIDLGNKVIALDQNKPYEVTFLKGNIVYKTYTYIKKSGVSKNGFLKVISQAKNYELLKEESIKYKEKVIAETTYQKDKPARFVAEKPKYFFKKGNVVKEIPTRKKDLAKMYPENSKKIKAFIKENKISSDEEADLIKLAEYLATL